jgi:hypothetical protein
LLSPCIRTRLANPVHPQTAHTGTKATPTKTEGQGGAEQSSYGGDYHPAQQHPEEGDYSDVQVGGEPAGSTGEKSAEGKTKLGASAASAGKTERDTEVGGLKEGGDRKLHGGVPGDVGGGTMPVGDEHEGGVDSTDPKNKAHGKESSTSSDPTSPTSTTESGHKPKLMDKIKGEMKILSGKISHKPEKVEEGQRLKTGSA